ncbi:MAG TPA: glycosyltransferase family 1 protein [Acidimicrobiia bacterium]
MVRVAVNVEQLLHDAPGGIGRYTAELVRLLPAAGVDVIAFTARHPRAAIDDALRSHDLIGVETVALPLPAPVLYDAWHVLGVGGPLRRVAPVDLVHAPSPAVPPTGRVPLVVTVHDAAPLTMPDAFTRRGIWFHRRGFAAAAKRARLVIAVSEFCADEIAQHTAIARPRIRIVPNGVHREPSSEERVARVRQQLGLDDRPYLLWVGSGEPRKNVGLLVEAFARLDPAVAPHRLVLVTPDGRLPAVQGRLDVLGDRVHLLGYVARDQLFALFAGADLFAFPSRHEGFGIPVLEAMAQSTAVVCSDIPALREVAGDAAQFVAVGDVDGWIDALTTLLSDDAARADLVARGRDRVAGYSWERCVEATVAVYREALQDRGRASRS